MINTINKLVGLFVNPLAIGMLLLLLDCLIVRFFDCWQRTKGRKFALGIGLLTFAWFWFWGMPITGKILALNLEKDYPICLAEDMPEADAIVLMGGGVFGTTNYPYANLSEGADRAWHAARLWKAGKAPIIIPSNVGAELADVKLLVDLGVPRESVILENKAVNTEENAKFVRRLLNEQLKVKDGRRNIKVLLVTSAIHMRRSLYMFEKYAPDIKVIPAATDYQALPYKDNPTPWQMLVPSIGAFGGSNALVHEYIGYWGYRVFR